MPTVILLRHGRTSANAGGVLAGWTPGVQLDETGETQVRAVAERLARVPLTAVISSPLERCRQTADAVAALSVILAPEGRVLVALAAPSMNPDVATPDRMSFQRGTISRSCTTRSTAASAAYNASWLLR